MEPRRYFSWSIFQLHSDLFWLYSLDIIDEIKSTGWVKMIFQRVTLWFEIDLQILYENKARQTWDLSVLNGKDYEIFSVSNSENV